jgi:hypothetical protein
VSGGASTAALLAIRLPVGEQAAPGVAVSGKRVWATMHSEGRTVIGTFKFLFSANLAATVMRDGGMAVGGGLVIGKNSS